MFFPTALTRYYAEIQEYQARASALARIYRLDMSVDALWDQAVQEAQTLPVRATVHFRSLFLEKTGHDLFEKSLLG
jgi:hypothetical protein